MEKKLFDFLEMIGFGILEFNDFFSRKQFKNLNPKTELKHLTLQNIVDISNHLHVDSMAVASDFFNLCFLPEFFLNPRDYDCKTV